jgi:hypothetical protein
MSKPYARTERSWKCRLVSRTYEDFSRMLPVVSTRKNHLNVVLAFIMLLYCRTRGADTVRSMLLMCVGSVPLSRVLPLSVDMFDFAVHVRVFAFVSL